MNDNPFSPLPPGLVLASSSLKHYRSDSGRSPIRQCPTDELLANLTPSTAIEAFRNPVGTLKQCLDAATLSEQSFVMAAAMASKHIQDWLSELSSWPWPSNSTSAGFDPSTPRGRGPRGHGRADYYEDLFPDEGSPAGGTKAWLGCLRADEVEEYERRVAEIREELDNIDMEGIKRHVLHNHILPLSRPGTPISDSGLPSTSTALFYNRMDDVTALITATVVQSLPNLSQLIRLMNTWNVRLLVLRRVPSTLANLDDAEVALRSGWNTVALGRRKSIASAAPDSPTSPVVPALVPNEFDVMKAVLEQKISSAARAIDFMLDTLDGRQETIPDEWIDRMDKLEKGFAEWVTVCEKTLRDIEWAKMTEGAAAPQHTKTQASVRMPQTPSTPASVSLDPKRKPETPMASEFNPEKSSRPQSSSRNETPSWPRMRSIEAGAADNELSPPSSPSYTSSLPPSLMARNARARSMSFSEMPAVPESDVPEEDDTPPKSPLENSFVEDKQSNARRGHTRSPLDRSEDDQLQLQISEILESIPAKIHLSSQPSPVNHLNPPDLQLPHLKLRPSNSFDRSQPPRSHSSLSTSSRAGSRAGTPSFLLAPAYARNTRSRAQRSNQDIKLYHLSRSTGEPPIKLFIRCVGEHGERVMVRVGGGWADLGEYLKEYAIHHGRRSKAGGESTKIEIKDLPALPSKITSSPASRPASALDSPITPLNVRKTRRSFGPDDAMRQHLPLAQQLPRTPMALVLSTPGTDSTSGDHSNTPPSEMSTRSRSSSRLSWTEEDSSLGMSGPRTKNVEMSDESRAWVASVKEKVRIASGERRQPPAGTASPELFGEMGKVGGTKRLFRKG